MNLTLETTNYEQRYGVGGESYWTQNPLYMTSRINFYSYIAISLIRIGDIANYN